MKPEQAHNATIHITHIHTRTAHAIIEWLNRKSNNNSYFFLSRRYSNITHTHIPFPIIELNNKNEKIIIFARVRRKAVNNVTIYWWFQRKLLGIYQLSISVHRNAIVKLFISLFRSLARSLLCAVFPRICFCLPPFLSHLFRLRCAAGHFRIWIFSSVPLLFEHINRTS